mmetsp:Transcript_26233/g.65206  ORF Transcript_26233/g.65206 Transcript_26233/m.65206 type:complete len:225 (+) Transcript_26233:1943-2617(+)
MRTSVTSDGSTPNRSANVAFRIACSSLAPLSRSVNVEFQPGVRRSKLMLSSSNPARTTCLGRPCAHARSREMPHFCSTHARDRSSLHSGMVSRGWTASMRRASRSTSQRGERQQPLSSSSTSIAFLQSKVASVRLQLKEGWNGEHRAVCAPTLGPSVKSSSMEGLLPRDAASVSSLLMCVSRSSTFGNMLRKKQSSPSQPHASLKQDTSHSPSPMYPTGHSQFG